VGDKWALGTDNATGLKSNSTATSVLKLGAGSLADQFGMDSMSVEIGQFSSIWIIFEVVGESEEAYLVEMSGAAQAVIRLNVSSTMKYPADGTYSASDLSRIQNQTYPGTVSKTTQTAITINAAVALRSTLTVDKATMLIERAVVECRGAFEASADAPGMPDIQFQPDGSGSYRVSVVSRDASAQATGSAVFDLDLGFDPGLQVMSSGSNQVNSLVSVDGTEDILVSVVGDKTLFNNILSALPEPPLDALPADVPGTRAENSTVSKAVQVDKTVPATVTLTDGKITKIKYSPRSILHPYLSEQVGSFQASLMLGLLFSDVEITSASLAQAEAKINLYSGNMAVLAARAADVSASLSGGTNDASPGGGVNETEPDGTNETTPGGTNDTTPGGADDATPGGTNDTAPDGTGTGPDADDVSETGPSGSDGATDPSTATATATSPESSAPEAESDEGRDGFPWIYLVIGTVAAAVIGLLALFAARKR